MENNTIHSNIVVRMMMISTSFESISGGPDTANGSVGPPVLPLAVMIVGMLAVAVFDLSGLLVGGLLLLLLVLFAGVLFSVGLLPAGSGVGFVLFALLLGLGI